MSDDFCELVPTAEECQAKPEPGPGDDGEMRPEGGDMKKMDGEKDMEGLLAQIDFLFVAVANLTSMYMTHFRYRSASDYYSDGDVLSTNYW